MEQKQIYELIAEFNDKFRFSAEDMDIERLMLKHSQAEEEANEMLDAIVDKNAEDVVDSLIDQVYIALGTLYLLDVDIRKAFLEVHMCNMAKERGIKTDRSYTLSGDQEFDVIKPNGWTGPDHSGNTGILKKLFKEM